MSRSLVSFATAAALLGATLTPSVAQDRPQPVAQPLSIIAGQSGGAGTSGGISSGGASVQTPVPPPPTAPPAEPLPPGPPAGPAQAAFYSNPAVIGGAVAVTAIVVCALVCFSHSTSTTTSTTVVPP